MRRVKANYGLIILCASIFLITFGAGAFIGKHMQVGPSAPSITAKAEEGKPINILFMGIDARKGETNSRSDTMILASADTDANKIAMVWIPRDTRVEVKRGHYDRINSVNLLQGPEAACKATGDLLDIRVDHYVVVNFDGFARIVDILGGVTLEVPRGMWHNDPDPKLRINLRPGIRRLNGQEALGYVRFRGTPDADIGRTGRQQKFIKALAEEMMQGKTILKLPELLPELYKNVHTNIPLKDMLAMVKVAKNFSSQEIYTQTLPGYSYTDRQTGASYWQADPEIAEGIIDDLFAGKKYDVAQDPPQWVKEQRRRQARSVAEENAPGEGQEQPKDKVDPGESEEPSALPGDESPGEPGREPEIQPGVPPGTDMGNNTPPPDSGGETTLPKPEVQPAPAPEPPPATEPMPAPEPAQPPAPEDNTGMHGY